MKETSGAVLLLALLALPTTVTRATSCTDFVTVNNTTGLSTDYSKLSLLNNCPASAELPKEFHYTISTSNETNVPAMAVTANQANLLQAALTSDGMTLQISESYAGNGAVGAELVFRSGQINELFLEGFGDYLYIDDADGSLTLIRDEGAANTISITSTSTETIKYIHRGASGSVLLDAPAAQVEIDVIGAQHDLRVKCATISGTIGGASDRLVVVSGEVRSIRMEGVSNKVDLYATQSTGGCANVVTDGLNNDCDDNSDVTFEIEPFACQGPAGVQECVGGSGGATTKGWGWWVMSTVLVLVFGTMV